MPSIQQVFALMIRLEGLKRTARTGWNKNFPPGHRFKTRRVEGVESVADHSWSLALFALVVADLLGLDAFKLVRMALIHDVAELITLDIVTLWELDAEERARLELEKKQLEDAAMREIFLNMGGWGLSCYLLWLEYEAQSSPEARVLRELDKFECAIQAVLYQEQGHELDASEFMSTADSCLKSPELVEMMALLRARAATVPR